MNTNKLPWLILSLVIFGLDQLTKYLAVSHLSLYQPEAILPGLNLTLAFNKGVAFSFLSDAGSWNRWFFAGFSTIMCVVLAVWLFKIPKQERLTQCALALILGGALGNLFDRVFNGVVTDFIDVYYSTHHWPIFNLADSAICIGAILFFIVFYNQSE